MKILLTLLIALLFGAIGTSAFADEPTPTTDPIADLQKIRFDSPPEALTQNRTYYVSDENELHLFRKVITPRKGIYLGLGSDPNYVFGAWAQAEYMILLDFDQNIVDLHRIYGAFFIESANVEAFLTLWTKDGEEAAHAAIEKHHPKRANWLKRIYADARRRVPARLEWMNTAFPENGAPTFLNDPAQYTFIRKMWQEGRIRPVRGDLTKEKAMSDVAAFARKHDLEVRTLYLTNAEYYFPFETGEYVNNITGLPMPDDSVVLHTFPRSQTEYRQIYESGPVYQKYVKSGKYENLRALLRRTKQLEEGVYLFEMR